MRKFILFLFNLIPFIGYSQAESEALQEIPTEMEAYKKISAEIEAYYNAGRYQDIFALFSDKMKAALPLKQTTDFLKGLKHQAGNIEKREFVTYNEDSLAIYKTTFQRALFGLKIALNESNEVTGLLVKPFKEEWVPAPKRNLTKMILPFEGEWDVYWGGDTKALNYHVKSAPQKNAFDILIIDKKGRSFKTNGLNNEDFYAFGKPLIAPCDAEVVLAVDGVKDNIPGVMNPVFLPGNTVILKTVNNEYLFFAHFKQHTVAVKQGQQVKQGDLLGLCGNSGNSSEAHLHFHIQNIEDSNEAIGIKCYFDEIYVNGKLKKDYSPIKGEKVRNK